MDLSSCLSRKSISEIQILLCCFFFGFTYVGQKQASNREMDVYSFTAGRFVVSTIFLYAIRAPLQDVIESDISDEKKDELDQLSMNKLIAKLRLMMPMEVSEKTFQLYFWATIYGIFNFMASELLQMGMEGATAGKSAFIIGLNVVVIQVIEMALPDYNTGLSWVICVAISLSVIGLYFLSGCFDLLFASNGESCADVITYYDFLVFLSMIGFGICILLADAGSSRTDCIDLMCLSFFVATLLTVIMAMINDLETWLSFPTLSDVFSYNTIIVIYTGVAEVSAVTLGTLGQMYISPTRSALIMSLEATSSAFLAYLFLNEVLTSSELIGCCLMFSATVLSTTVSVDDGTESDEVGDLRPYGSMSGDKRADTTYDFDFDKTSDQLERFMKTKQRSLHHIIAIRRSRSRTLSQGVPTGGSAIGVINENTSLLQPASIGGSLESKCNYESL